MTRVQFVETVTLPLGPNGSIIPVSGIGTTPFSINLNQTEGPQAPAYAGRTGNTLASSLATDSTGTVSYWLESGDYNIHFQDQQSPARITAYIRGFNAAVATQGTVATGTAYAGDYKLSEQVNDHGLNPDNSYQWLLVVSDASGAGRQVDHIAYQSLWQELGSPTPDGSGLFRLPNISGRILVAAGHASGLSIRTLRDIFGEESHTNSNQEMPVHAHGGGTGGATTGTDSPDHAHNISVAAGIFGTVWSDDGGANNIAGGTTTRIGRVGPTGSASGATSRHTHGVPSLGIANDGGGAAHNNLQPSYVGNLFIKS